MRDPAPATVIVECGDGALGASLDVAMLDRGRDVASPRRKWRCCSSTCARERKAALLTWPGIKLNCCML